MKSLFLYFCFISYVFTLSSCNNDDNAKRSTTDLQSDQKNTPGDNSKLDIDCSTIGNFLVSEHEAKKWIGNFHRIFRKTGKTEEVKGLASSFWIDASVIMAFQKFLNDSTSYKGVRIHFGFNKDSSEIFLVPTIPDTPGHNDQWKAKIPFTGSTPAYSNYNREFEYVFPLKKNFGRNYRKEKVPGQVSTAINDSLSSSIWFSKCVFDALKNYLSNSTYNLDGIRIYCAAYDKKHTGSKQLKDVQSTVVIVITKPDGSGGHKDDWSILEKIYKIEEKFAGGGYNHGELCPTVCN